MWIVLFCIVCATTVATEPTNYASQIKPLFAARCIACHGALKQESGLRLDTGILAKRGGNDGLVIVPKDLSASRLLTRVKSQDVAERMPPDGEPLTETQIQSLQQWITQGAISPEDEQPEKDPREHWAYQPVRRPTIPAAKNRWSRNAIDHFIGEAHQRAGLIPQDEATHDELIRRLYIDLIGVPPSLADLSSLSKQAKTGEDWYGRLVDQLLNDSRHGERWGRHWMDVWRYSDWWGLGDQLRNSQFHIWRWRDWVIEALNADMPYDEMVRLMLAGDEIAPLDDDKLRATGFLARNYFLFNRNQWMDETVEHVSKAFLGITMNCAKCHDHKYDPIEQVDYYRMRAFFEPYHVRLDMVPGEMDLNRDGLPRVFDGHLDLPTYVFVRGQENQPDKSQAVLPGIPAFLASGSLHIGPIKLPPQSYQPERREWVQKAYLDAALSKVKAAAQRLADTVAKLDVQKDPATTEVDVEVEKLRVNHANAALSALRAQIVAHQASWVLQDTVEKTEMLLQAERDHHGTAIKAERASELALAQFVLAEVKNRKAKLADEKKATLDKELKAAEESLAQAEKQVEAVVKPEERCQPLLAAKWTPTRFFSSLKDDPSVSFGPISTGRRRGLANWITDPRNPLTARVAVNHLWSRHMGTPLVQTVFDFGRKNQPPLHAELLDWLASELVDSGWSMKHIHKLIVCSATYRLSSLESNREASLAADPANTFFWRRTPQRLESEVVRDALLELADSLDCRVGGPSIKQAEQAASRRRSLYFFHSNNERNLFLTTFDEAMVKECYRRDESIVPQQALALINSQLALDMTKPIAEQIVKGLQEAGLPIQDRSFIEQAFWLLLGAKANDLEIDASLESMDALRQSGNTTEQAQAMLVWALLNHSDFVTLR
jgi:Protein of unknown function (DUF1553)/Protein of unknown function (DUF1549)/Planctomycete cytochrome C